MVIKHRHKELEEALENHRQAIADICRELGLYGASAAEKGDDDCFDIIVVNMRPVSISEAIHAILRYIGGKLVKDEKARVAPLGTVNDKSPAPFWYLRK